MNIKKNYICVCMICFVNLLIAHNFLYYQNTNYFDKKITKLMIIVIERDRKLEFDVLRTILLSDRNCNTYLNLVHVEQSFECLFNRGMLANIGFLEGMKIWKDVDRVIIHDTDMFPESVLCYDKPYQAPVIHYATRVSQFQDKLPYSTYFGGVVGFTPLSYNHVNGFSNQFWGWGGEDDDLYNRVVNNGFNIVSSSSGRFMSISHERNKDNLQNNLKTLNTPNRSNDGLKNVYNYANSFVTRLSENEIHIVVNTNNSMCPKIQNTNKPVSKNTVVTNSYYKSLKPYNKKSILNYQVSINKKKNYEKNNLEKLEKNTEQIKKENNTVTKNITETIKTRGPKKTSNQQKYEYAISKKNKKVKLESLL